MSNKRPDTQPKKNAKLLLEMRPALEGFAGIPQETRLLYRGLRMLDSIDVVGMLQTSHRTLARGTQEQGGFFSKKLSEGRKINRYSRAIISLAQSPHKTIVDKLLDWMQKRFSSAELTLWTIFGLSKIRLSDFRSRHFEDFIWRTLFAKTLASSDFDLVTSSNQKICSVPYHIMHVAGLNTLNFFPSPRYPRLDTSNVDIFIAQTPYPARINRSTAFIVRYHDAIPMFMPHTIPDKSVHQATHFYALLDNVKSGAYFACVSDATRNDLLTLFPEAEKRAVTIYNMVSHHYTHAIMLKSSKMRRISMPHPSF